MLLGRWPAAKGGELKMTVTCRVIVTSLLGCGVSVPICHVTVLLAASYVPPSVAETNSTPAGRVSTNRALFTIWVPPAETVMPTR